MAANGINKGHVPWLWHVALFTGLAALHVAGQNFEEILKYPKWKEKIMNESPKSARVCPIF